MDMFLIFLLLLPFILVVLRFFMGRRISIHFVIVVFGFILMILVGYQVISEVFMALPGSTSNSSMISFGLFDNQECEKGEYIPKTSIEKECKGKTSSITMQSCDEGGRICSSKTIDCGKVNKDGVASIEEECSTSGGIYTTILAISGIITIGFILLFSMGGIIRLI